MSNLPALKPEGLSADQHDALKKLLGLQPGTSAEDAAIARTAAQTSFPLSFAQQRMMVLQQMAPDGWLYNIPFAMRLRGALDRSALQAALGALVGRHEILRTTIEMSDQGFVQRVHPPTDFVLPLSYPQDGVTEERGIEDFVLQQTRRPFDLSKDAVLRVGLLRLAEHDHVFTLTLHHIFSDAASNRTLLAELRRLYASALNGAPVRLPQPALQYGDYALWQQSVDHKEKIKQQVTYWKRALEGAPAAIDLPLLKGRGTEDAHTGDIVSFTLSPEVEGRLRTIMRANSASLFMVSIAALTAFLARYSGQEDIVIGTPISGRTRVDFEAVPGLFTNTLVMRNAVDDQPSFHTMVSRARNTALAAYEYQDVPFEMLVSEVQPERDLTRHPIFQVFLIMQEASKARWQLEGTIAEPVELHSYTSKFDLSFGFLEDGENIRGSITFSTALFDRDFIEKMAANLGVFLDHASAAPDVPLTALPLLAKAQIAELQALATPHLRPGAADPHAPAAMHLYFERQALLTPDAIAIDCRGQETTYAELNSRADSIAARILQQLEPTDDAIVAVYLPRTPELIAALLGILKAGCAFVALDLAYPPSRIAAMLDDCNPSLLLTASELSVQLPCGAQTVFLDEPLHDDLPAPRQPRFLANSAAYIIYTSGSTGQPKGIVIEHRSVLTLLRWAREVWSEEDFSGVLASTSVCFDISIFEIFAPLSWGGLVVLAENALELPDLSSRERVRLLNTVPSAMTELLRIEGLPSSLRTVNLAGEALSRKLIDQVQEIKHVSRITNLYGPSEDTTYSTCRVFDGDDARAITIGQPIANTSVYILAPDLQMVPRGVTGELYLAGDGLARGYLGKPGMTAERFLPDPFGPPGTRMYRSGDLARWRPDGDLDCLGRIDYQVKVRGFRVELEEVERAISTNPDIGQVVAIVREDRTGDKRLVAYYVAKDGHTVRERDLRSDVARILPGFMVPSSFVGMAAFPLTPNGKIDRKNFAAPTLRPQVKQAYRPPTDPLRWQLVTIWEDLLNVSPIGVHDNFFEIGGDSLLAVQLIYRIDKICGMRLPLAVLFTHPTIENLSRVMVENLSGAWSSPVVKVQAGDPTRKPPFFYLHADFMSGGFYSVDLARHLPSDQPFYILQPHGLDGGEIPETIEEMARQHLQEMRQVQPHGPYYFGGKCGGSMIAYEMARLLEQENEPVALLAVVHGWPGARYLGFKRQLKPASRAPKAELLQAASYQTRKLWALYRYNWAIKTYMPEPYSGTVTLLWPDGVPLRGHDATAGWSEIAGNVEVHSIAGDSYSSITRFIDQFGACLGEILGQAQRRSGIAG